MTGTSVRAVIVGPDQGTGDAVARQVRRPDDVLPHPGPWHEAVRAAAGPHDWLWLLEGGVRPEARALAALTATLEDLGDLPFPALLASRVVGADGALDGAGAPWVPLHDRRVVIAAAAHGLASLRLARWGSLLVSGAAIAAHGPPLARHAGGADDLEWTSRLLRDGAGYAVPESVAVRAGGTPRTGLREARDRLRILRGDGWAPHEAAWFAYASLGEALGSARTPSRSPRATVRRLDRLARFARR